MATIDLSAYLRAPATRLLDSAMNTNWHEVILPPWCTVVVITSSASLYYALAKGADGRTQPVASAAASGTSDKVSVAVSGTEGKFSVVMRDAEDKPGVVGVIPNRSIFVAAQSGTAAVSIELGVGR
jgi:hypothetical protein